MARKVNTTTGEVLGVEVEAKLLKIVAKIKKETSGTGEDKLTVEYPIYELAIEIERASISELDLGRLMRRVSEAFEVRLIPNQLELPYKGDDVPRVFVDQVADTLTENGIPFRRNVNLSEMANR